MARAKIEASEIAERIEENLSIIVDLGAKHPMLFADKQQLVEKSPEDLKTIIQARITTYEAQEKAKAEAAAEREREKIRQEEQAKFKASPDEPEAVSSTPATTEVPEPAIAAPALGQAPAAEYVSVLRSHYEKLQADSRLLNALRAAGVDNWGGYDHALELMETEAA